MHHSARSRGNHRADQAGSQDEILCPIFASHAAQEGATPFQLLQIKSPTLIYPETYSNGLKSRRFCSRKLGEKKANSVAEKRGTWRVCAHISPDLDSVT